jgi:L-ascorbate metabolism protein UlaG (beta-lactamase superfamily)
VAVAERISLPADRGPLAAADSLTFIGTATALIRYAGFTILTDPNFLHRGEQVHLGYGLRATRRTEPALGMDQLPPLDLVALSHLHEDHFDRVVERRLDRALPIVTTRSAAEALRRKGFAATRGLETWDAVEFTRGDAHLRITALPGLHAPRPLHLLLPPVMGSLMEMFAPGAARPLRIYQTGDTLLYEGLREIARRHPDIDLMLLHLGGTRVLGVMVTMDGRQGARVLRLIRPARAIPIHYDDYTTFKSPLSDFQREVRSAGLEPMVTYVARGAVVPLEGPAG